MLGTLAGSRCAIMAVGAAAGNRVMVKISGPPRYGGMAIITGIAALDMGQ